jgi:hypothetical protein
MEPTPEARPEKETVMSNRRLISLFFCTSALAVCSVIVISMAFAADFPVGRYEAKGLILTFDDKGQFQVSSGSTPEVSGNYAVQGSRIELTDIKGPWACTSAGQQTGTYTWKLDSAVLNFTKVADSCEDRSGTLAPVGWKRQK